MIKANKRGKNKMKLTKEAREKAKKISLEYAKKYYPEGSKAIISLSRISGSRVVSIKRILNCGAIIVDHPQYGDFRLNPFLPGVVNDDGSIRNEEPFFSKDSYTLRHFSGQTEDFDDIGETKPEGLNIEEDYKGWKIKFSIIGSKLGTQINVRAYNINVAENAKKYIFFNKNKEEVLNAIKPDLDIYKYYVLWAERLNKDESKSFKRLFNEEADLKQHVEFLVKRDHIIIEDGVY